VKATVVVLSLLRVAYDHGLRTFTTKAIPRLLWRFALVAIRVTPAAAPVAVGGVFPLTVTVWPRPPYRFVLGLRASDPSIIEVPQEISGYAGCSALTVMAAAQKLGDAEITATLCPRSRFGPSVQRIAQRVAAALGLGCARSRLTVERSPLLIVAPHPDDEALMASGVIVNALENGQPAKVVLVTNGDHREGMAYGLKRQQESITALCQLGLQETDIVFLGYPGDVTGLLRMMNNYLTADVAYTSVIGAGATYGTSGLGKRDFHAWLTGQAAAYNAPNLQGDLETLVRAWRPAHIYTTSRFDEHPDHRAVYYFVARAVQCVRLEEPFYAPILHTTTIHDITTEPYDDFWGHNELSPFRAVDFSGDFRWPLPAHAAEHSALSRFDASAYFSQPPNFWRTGLPWSAVESLPVPPSMRVTTAAQNLKYQVLTSYASQPLHCLVPYCKQDEIFWMEFPPASALLAFPPVQLHSKPGRAAVLAVALVKPANAPRAIAFASSDEGVVVVPPAVIVPTGAVTAVCAVRAVGVGTATVSANLDEPRVVANITVTGDEIFAPQGHAATVAREK
jgi:LmbE family N-acetylglucosaminyl deacetylase